MNIRRVLQLLKVGTPIAVTALKWLFSSDGREALKHLRTILANIRAWREKRAGPRDDATADRDAENMTAAQAAGVQIATMEWKRTKGDRAHCMQEADILLYGETILEALHPRLSPAERSTLARSLADAYLEAIEQRERDRPASGAEPPDEPTATPPKPTGNPQLAPH